MLVKLVAALADEDCVRRVLLAELAGLRDVATTRHRASLHARQRDARVTGQTVLQKAVVELLCESWVRAAARSGRRSAERLLSAEPQYPGPPVDGAISHVPYSLHSTPVARPVPA